MSVKANSEYWDAIADRNLKSAREDVWRIHLKEIYRRMIFDGNNAPGKLWLKTDLYDETITDHSLFSLLSPQRLSLVGMDCSPAVAGHARQRLTRQKIALQGIVVTDIRKLSFEDNSFDTVISNSTLDHFPSKDDIVAGIKELFRVLKPKGELILTLDNPLNPVIRLRNALPYGLLKSAGIIPFYMGATLSRSELIRVLEGQGFKVRYTGAIVHCPRFFAIWIGSLVALLRSNTATGCFLKLLGICERLEKSPLKYLSGYFTCVKATKPATTT
ncbi:MAG TPA: methyltransferase domain-containing protein [Patescibacteria group bacterium]|nr:methyltransferase domain-containing protein [Patescibacteria group bacterium]